MKQQYRTRQREELLSFLASRAGKHVTAGEIVEYFQQSERSIGTATIYRQLDKLVESGQVNKYLIDGVSGACFEYIDTFRQCHHPACYHCKCEVCGKLIHLDCAEVEELGRHMLREHGFEIDLHRTVFYGRCSDCRKEEASGT